MIYADPVHTINLFINILDNAIKYSGENPRVSIETQNTNRDKIMIRICDNGPGIPHEQQKMVFKQFYRGKKEQKSGKSGFGLGLFYVKKIVNQHNGKVTIRSAPEQGTCFSVYLTTIDKEL
jgi:signal transduction histidine kinase